MNTRITQLSAVVVILIGAVALSGCSSTGQPDARAGSASASASASATPTVPAPPSSPVTAETLRDTVSGTSVKPLAIVTDFPVPADAPPLVKPVLVEVRVAAGDEFSNDVFVSAVSITPRDANLDLVSLGLSNPDTLTPAMAAAGYAPLGTVPHGTTATGWIGAWVNPDDTDYDLVYDRPAGTVLHVGGTDNGKEIAGSRSITTLTVG
jgi:hypothetical protein